MLRKILMAVFGLGAATAASLGAVQETGYEYAYDSLVFTGGTTTLAINTYAFIPGENRYIARYNDGRIFNHNATWDKRSRQEVTRFGTTTFTNPRAFQQTSVIGRKYEGVYPSGSGKVRMEWSQQEFDDVKSGRGTAPTYKTLTGFSIPLANAAIAINATSSGNGGATAGTTLTIAHTVAGSNRLINVIAHNDGGTDISSVTWNGSGLAEDFQYDGDTSWQSSWSLVAPETGTFNVVITWAASEDGRLGFVTSFTGAAQTGQPHATSSYHGYFSGASQQGPVLNITEANVIAVVQDSASDAGATDNISTPASGQTVQNDSADAFETATAQQDVKTATMSYSAASSTANLKWTHSTDYNNTQGIAVAFDSAPEAAASTPQRQSVFDDEL